MKLMQILWIFVLVSCSSLSQKSTGPEVDAPVLQFQSKKVVLNNGLTLILVKNPKLPVFTYYTFYKVGSKHEIKGITGASHYLEHMMFKGAKNFGAGRFDKLIEGNGGSSNAYTSNDFTVYYESMPLSSLPLIINVEADRLQNLLLEKDAFEKERAVVLEERKFRYENSPRGQLYLALMENMFVGTPYGTSVIGHVEDLQKVTRDQMMAYFKKFYAPNNAVVVISGDLDLDKTEAMVRKSYGEIPAVPNLEQEKKEFEDGVRYASQAKLGRNLFLKGQSPRPMFVFGFQGRPQGDKVGYVLDILGTILGDGESSFLTREFVLNKNPQLTDVYAYHMSLVHSGVFMIGGQLLDQTNRAAFKEALISSLQKACDEAITKESVQKAINKYTLSLYESMQTNAGIAHTLGNSEVFYKDYKFFAKELALYQAIGPQEVKELCRQELTQDKSLFITVWQKEGSK